MDRPDDIADAEPAPAAPWRALGAVGRLRRITADSVLGGPIAPDDAAWLPSAAFAVFAMADSCDRSLPTLVTSWATIRRCLVSTAARTL